MDLSTSAFFKTTKEWEMNILLGQIESNTYVKPSKITVKQFFENWLTTPAALKLASKTFVNYRQCIKLRIVPWLGDNKIDELKRSHLNEFYQRMYTLGKMLQKNPPLLSLKH